jgi:hypothetical protein
MKGGIMKSTPGPWIVFTNNEGNPCVATGTNFPPIPERGICMDIYSGSHNNPHLKEAKTEQLANAFLIAASPIMLETLERIADIAPGNGDVCELIARRARAAIRVAYGETKWRIED